MAKKRGRPRRWIPSDGREGFKTRLKPETVEALRRLGQGWANRGIEHLVRRYQSESEIHE